MAIKKKPFLVLCPMAGLTDSPFRQLCREWGADRVYSEMISVDALFYKFKKNEEFYRFQPMERPVILQLFGHKPKLFFEATKKLAASSYRPDGFDINFGCPAKKVVHTGNGVALMLKPELAREIVAATILAADNIPVSIKIRAGNKDMTALKFLESLADLSWKTVMIHGRTYEQGFAGSANWGLAKKIKEVYPDKEVIVNGGIITPEDAYQAWEESGADGLGLGQGIIGKPWLFAQIKDYFETKKYVELNLEQIKTVARYHLQVLVADKGESSIITLRKHLAWYFKGFPGAAQWRDRLVRVSTVKEVLDVLDSMKD